ncbi:hypothetical protein HPHPP62_1574 [Helicobacter pylori Hp P-62]|nr:hypothetical protein HPHPP62_1574 [Helicobacter pylori Hp P-62]
MSLALTLRYNHSVLTHSNQTTATRLILFLQTLINAHQCL